jgi:hypothetical protein
MSRTRWEASFDKRRALNQAEDAGLVADSMDVRMKLIERMKKGELTLEEVQAELKKIKRNAKKNGLVTRSQAFSRG